MGVKLDILVGLKRTASSNIPRRVIAQPPEKTIELNQSAENVDVNIMTYRKFKPATKTAMSSTIIAKLVLLRAVLMDAFNACRIFVRNVW
mmetsp:Transcript_119296/g.345067  ORF Transcript_119296/g.345067 Transcript_119296/m.345067 type:complete len:90 (+) Transcript_119296:205-474(+)